MERAQNYSPPTSFSSLSIGYSPCLFSTPGHLRTQQAKIVQSWKGVASAMHTATPFQVRTILACWAHK